MIQYPLEVICSVCRERIGRVSSLSLSYPLQGSMIESPDKAHGVPDPFPPEADWEHLLCPHGRNHRPFFDDNKILTDKGTLIIPRDGSEIYLVEPCFDADREDIFDRPLYTESEAEQKVREQIAGVAQQEEQLICNQSVDGSIPSTGSNDKTPCPECGKEVSRKGMSGHRRFKHGVKA